MGALLDRDGSVLRHVELGSSESMRSAGVAPQVGIGAAIACLGDLTGDGMITLAVGQDPGFEARGLTRSVFLVTIDMHAEVQAVATIHASDDFTQDLSWFGKHLAALGDVDGDGVGDLAIANTYDFDGGEMRGAVWIVLLGAHGGVKGKQKISDWAGGFDGLLTDDSRLGRALAAPGDLDGNDVPDLLVCSEGTIWTLLLQRDGYVLGFQQTALLDTVGNKNKLGISLACTSNVAGQGRVIAAGGTEGSGPNSDGIVWLLKANKDGSLAAW